MAYRVVDIDAACAALRDQGVRLLYDAPRRGTAGSRINFVHPRDAGGVLVELVEPAARRPLTIEQAGYSCSVGTCSHRPESAVTILMQ